MNTHYMNYHSLKKYLTVVFAILFISLHYTSQGQPFSYSNPEEYTIKAITVSGIKFADPTVIMHIAGLYVGDKVTLPGEQISNAIEKLWDQGLFSDIKITASEPEGEEISLDIYLRELPRISAVEFDGLKKSEQKDLTELIQLRIGTQATDNVLNNAKRIIVNHFHSKAFLNTKVDITQQNDTLIPNGVRIKFNVDKGPKVRIADIDFNRITVETDEPEKKGVSNLLAFNEKGRISERKLRKAMKNTKRKDINFFKTSKFIEKNYEEDMITLIDFYNKNGFRDARVLGDSVYVINEKRIGLVITVDEGPKYFFRDVHWMGNSKLPDEILSQVLGIQKGDIYDKELLEERLFIDENSISTTYMDDGYLFFHIEPVEVRVANDSIDLEMRIFEGSQATVNDVNIVGNSKTHEHVVRRELHSKPGELFSKTKINRSIRELANLGHFDPEKLRITPVPNPADGTVDLTYIVEEKPNDQFEVSGGWGQGMFVGTVGIRFSNFSVKRIFDKKAWRPVPSGDSQTLSVRAQSNGSYFKAFSFTFMEPWLGGKKPTNFTFSAYHTIHNIPGTVIYQRSDQSMKVTGGAVGIGTRLKWPDDWFTFYNEVSYQNYTLSNWTGHFIFSDGKSNNFNYKAVLTRSSISQPLYPRNGSTFSLSLQLTPPYSLINGKDYTSLTVETGKYNWIEYHKWTGKAQWFQSLWGDLVLFTGAQFGYLGYYNKDVGYSPFEGFDVGGDGMSGYRMYGVETIGLRGYENSSLTPQVGSIAASNIYTKYTVELRYPAMLQPQAALYGLVFLEAGNAWYEFKTLNPFNVHRSAGVGARVFLPMIGMLGIDWAYGFDKIPHNPNANGGQFHFIIGQSF